MLRMLLSLCGFGTVFALSALSFDLFTRVSLCAVLAAALSPPRARLSPLLPLLLLPLTFLLPAAAPRAFAALLCGVVGPLLHALVGLQLTQAAMFAGAWSVDALLPSPGSRGERAAQAVVLCAAAGVYAAAGLTLWDLPSSAGATAVSATLLALPLMALAVDDFNVLDAALVALHAARCLVAVAYDAPLVPEAGLAPAAEAAVYAAAAVAVLLSLGVDLRFFQSGSVRPWRPGPAWDGPNRAGRVMAAAGFCYTAAVCLHGRCEGLEALAPLSERWLLLAVQGAVSLAAYVASVLAGGVVVTPEEEEEEFGPAGAGWSNKKAHRI